MAGDGTPIIIKKKKSHGHGHHGGSWKVAYADFVTAMMAFFMVMWILGLSDESKAEISGYFNDPFGYSKTTPLVRNIVRFPGVPVTSGGTFKRQQADVVQTSRRAVLKVQTEVERQIEELIKGGLTSKSGIGAGALSKGTKGPADQKGKGVHQTGGSKKDNSGPGELMFSGSLKDLLKHIDVVVTDEGLRIEFLEDTNRNIFFDTGSATLKKEALAVIRVLAPILAEANRTLKVEGHTDARPYGAGATYNNWDLSSDRANSLRRALQNSGIRPDLFIGVSGYADTRLKNPSNPLDGKNRRVSILVPTQDETVKEIQLADIRPNKASKPNIVPGINVTDENPVKDPRGNGKKSFWKRGPNEGPSTGGH